MFDLFKLVLFLHLKNELHYLGTLFMTFTLTFFTLTKIIIINKSQKYHRLGVSQNICLHIVF